MRHKIMFATKRYNCVLKLSSPTPFAHEKNLYSFTYRTITYV